MKPSTTLDASLSDIINLSVLVHKCVRVCVCTLENPLYKLQTIFLSAFMHICMMSWLGNSPLMSLVLAETFIQNFHMSSSLIFGENITFSFFAYIFPLIPPASNVGLNYHQSYSRICLLIIHHLEEKLTLCQLLAWG